MTSISHGPPTVADRRWTLLREAPRAMWASIAVVAMWLAVLFDAVFGPDIVSSSGLNGSTTSVPSAVVVAFFAFLGTGAVARYGFAERDR